MHLWWGQTASSMRLYENGVLMLTLFVITLCLNIGALYIVRRYREQYE